MVKPRPIVTRNAEDWAEDSKNEIRDVVVGELSGKETKTSKSLEKIADKGVENIQDNISAGGFAPLEESTITIKRNKGSRWPTKVALDSGLLFQSVEKHIK